MTLNKQEAEFLLQAIDLTARSGRLDDLVRARGLQGMAFVAELSERINEVAQAEETKNETV